jgi:hypothetical protein
VSARVCDVMFYPVNTGNNTSLGKNDSTYREELLVEDSIRPSPTILFIPPPEIEKDTFGLGINVVQKNRQMIGKVESYKINENNKGQDSKSEHNIIKTNTNQSHKDRQSPTVTTEHAPSPYKSFSPGALSQQPQSSPSKS